MVARITEIILFAAIAISLFTAMFVLPRIERRENEPKNRDDSWTIIDGEFIDFMEEPYA